MQSAHILNTSIYFLDCSEPKMKFRQILGKASPCVRHKPYVLFPFSPPDNYMTVCTPFFALSATEACAQAPFFPTSTTTTAPPIKSLALREWYKNYYTTASQNEQEPYIFELPKGNKLNNVPLGRSSTRPQPEDHKTLQNNYCNARLSFNIINIYWQIIINLGIE